MLASTWPKCEWHLQYDVCAYDEWACFIRSADIEMKSYKFKEVKNLEFEVCLKGRVIMWCLLLIVSISISLVPVYSVHASGLQLVININHHFSWKTAARQIPQGNSLHFIMHHGSTISSFNMKKSFTCKIAQRKFLMYLHQVELYTKSLWLHPVFGPPFTLYLPLSVVSAKSGSFVISQYEMMKLSI
jgi:hypothetical protein